MRVFPERITCKSKTHDECKLHYSMHLCLRLNKKVESKLRITIQFFHLLTPDTFWPDTLSLCHYAFSAMLYYILTSWTKITLSWSCFFQVYSHSSKYLVKLLNNRWLLWYKIMVQYLKRESLGEYHSVYI